MTRWFVDIDVVLQSCGRVGIVIESDEKPTPENIKALVDKHGYNLITQENYGSEEIIGWETDNMEVVKDDLMGNCA